MKKLLLIILVLLAGTGFYLWTQRAHSNPQINNTAQDCPPFCVPDKKSCG